MHVSTRDSGARDGGATPHGPARPIALLVNVLGSGGAQRRIATLANRFVALGRAVDVVSVDPGGPMRAMLSPDVRVVTLVPEGTAPLLSNAVYARRLVRYLDETRPAGLMSCVTDTHLLAVVANARHGRLVPLILRASRHPYRPISRWHPIKRAIEPINLRKSAWCYRRADAIVALSADMAEGLHHMLRGVAIPIETILNPVIEAISPDAAALRVGRAKDPVPVILGIGRLVEQKDFATLLRAFALVRADRPVRLVLLGTGKQAGRLAILARKLGIARDFEMAGEVDDVAERMRDADLVVSSSLWEGSQATLIEALAAGCPVVATDCPGSARETLEDGRLGPLVPVRNPRAMAAAMLDQLDHPTAPALLVAGAARFTPAGKAERYLDVFDSCRKV